MNQRPSKRKQHSAYACAVALLARREHSKQELVQKLAMREYTQAEIEDAFERLDRHGLQSDERFAEAYVRMRERAGFGPVKIRLELAARGVSDSLIDAYISSSEMNWYDSAVRAWQKKFRGVKPSSVQERAKQTRFLLQRGFSHEHIKGIECYEQ